MCNPSAAQMNGKALYVNLLPFLEKNTSLFCKVGMNRERRIEAQRVRCNTARYIRYCHALVGAVIFAA